MVKYAKCPRCELNYIDVEKQQYCDICIKEMKGLEDSFLLIENEEDELMELCPLCGENMIRAGEDMCEQCKKKLEYEEEDVDINMEADEEWRNYLDEDVDAPDELNLDEEFGAEFADEEDEESEEEYQQEEDDFEYVTGDDLYKYEDFDDDDEDDDEDDDF